jgi:hypothetical protein
MAQGSNGSAAAKRLAEEKVNRDYKNSKNRTDKYGVSGMGENYSGVLNKDKKKLNSMISKYPEIHSAIPRDINKRGNIETFVPVYRALQPKVSRIGGY